MSFEQAQFMRQLLYYNRDVSFVGGSMQQGVICGILIRSVLAPTEALCGIEIQIQPRDAILGPL